MTINAKWVRENWLVLTILAGAVSGGLKFKWDAQQLEKRVASLEGTVKVLYDDNLLRKGAAEVWRARRLIGPEPDPARERTPQ